MREIKFRGKRLDNGEWTYGYYLKSASTLIAVDSGLVDGHFELYEVDPETVGQYTGEKDVNGNEIYEGDKVLFTISDLRGNSIHRKGVVVYREGAWQIQKSEHHNYEFWFVCKLASEIQITDNIHDNPGILEVPK